MTRSSSCATGSWAQRLLIAGLMICLAGCALVTPPEPSDEITYKALSFDGLAGWQDDSLAAALALFQESCGANRASDWQATCAASLALPAGDEAAARGFFETWFQPVLIARSSDTQALFTGYYEPVLQGALERSEHFSTPLLTRPADLIQVNLGDFQADLKGRRIAGRVEGSKLVPFEDRAAIEAGALDGAAQALVYLADPVDAFFLHVQGSGRIRLPDGEEMRVNYAGQNGHAYTAIGRILIDRNEVAREDMSMQAIRTWLAAHPGEARELMNQNASYIFFRAVEIADPSLGPIGAQSIPLTSLRSLAVDPSHHRLGTPLWVETNLPLKPGQEIGEPFHHLMVAQDTGGAIKGAQRGDIFFGSTEEAASLAGRMNGGGRAIALLPKDLAARLIAQSQR